MTRFDRTTALEPDGAGRFVGELDPSWSSLRGIHGGYVAAHVVRAVERVVDDGRTVRTVSMAFLRPASPGPVRVAVEAQRDGRTISTHLVTVEQDDRAIAHARVTTAVPMAGAPAWATDPFELPPPPEECEPISPPEGVRHFEQADALLDPAGRPFSRSPRARVAGWVRPREPRPVDASWLTMILDWFPPSAFVRVDPPTGGVSVDLTVHLHATLDALGGGEWLAGVFRTDTAGDGLALEHGVIADGRGRLLAESFHTRLAS